MRECSVQSLSAGSSSLPSGTCVEDIVDRLVQEVDVAEDNSTQRFLGALSTGSSPLCVARNILHDKEALQAVEKFLHENVAKNPSRHPAYGQILSSFRSMSCTCAADDTWDAHENECDFHDSAFTISDLVAGLSMVILQSELVPWILPLVGSAALMAAADQRQRGTACETKDKDKEAGMPMC